MSDWVLNTSLHLFRQNSRYCGSENSMECDSSDHASKVLKSKCNDKKKCTIKADSQDLDNAKPPCPGMLKYLMVNYICKPASSKFSDFTGHLKHYGFACKIHFIRPSKNIHV